MSSNTKRADTLPAAELVIAVLFLLSLALVKPATAQTLGTKYTWVDSIRVTYVKGDTIFPYKYEQCSMWFVGCDGFVKIGGESDTTEFASRHWLPLDAGQVLTTGPADRLKRLWFKTSSSWCTLYIIGYKTVPQY